MLLHTDTYKTFERKLIQVRLGDRQKINAHPCGYIAPDGKIFSCAPYEHIDKIKTILRNKEVGMPGEKYKEFEDYIFDNDVYTHNYSL